MKLIERQSLLRTVWAASPNRREAAAHTPQFHAEDLMEFIAIRDGDRPVALFHRPWMHLEMREFYADGRCGADFEIRRPYHGPAIRGMGLLKVFWRNDTAAITSTTREITVTGGGETLDICLNEVFGDDEHGFHRLRLYYDTDFGCYGVAVEAEMELLRPCMVEVSNFYSHNVGVANPELKRAQHTLWANRDGGFTYFPHNPLTPNLPGNMDAAGRRGVPVGGFITYGTEPDCNATLEIGAAHTDALGFATCSAFYDEHFLCGCPAPLEADGKYRWSLRYRMLSIPPAFAAELRDRATLLDFGMDPSSYDSWAYLNAIRKAGRTVQPMDQALPFVMGDTMDMERAIDPAELVIGNYWLFKPQPYGAATWDRTRGYQSQSSLCLTGRAPQARLQLATTGPTIRIDPPRPYRFRAMVKTAFAGPGCAWLELKPHNWGVEDCTNTYRSDRLAGDRDWQELTILLPPQPEAPHLAVYLKLEGQGKAWFDNVCLEAMDS